MDVLDTLWGRIILQDWFYRLPEALRDRATFFLTLAAVLGVPLLAVLWVVTRRLRGAHLGADDELRDLKRSGDQLALGRRYEHLGKHGKALAAYQRGGHSNERADLLLRLGRVREARAVAREADDAALYAHLCEKDGDLEGAAAAYEDATRPGEAARVWALAGQPYDAARCFIQAERPAEAVKALGPDDGPRAAELLEAAVRTSLRQARGDAMSPEMAAAVRRGAQLLLAQGHTRRAYKLALDSRQWDVAVPIARDYLEPDPSMLDVCEKAGNLLAAAEIAKKLEDPQREALYRGRHLQHRQPADAAQWLERAESWADAAEQYAAAGDKRRAADLYARAEEHDLAAGLYAEIGEVGKQREMEEAKRSHDPQSIFAAAQPDANELADSASALAAEAPTVVNRNDAEPSVASPSAGSPSTLPAGDERYVRRGELGRGAMGVVYRAFDTVLHRDVALKVLSQQIELDPKDARLLLEEARAAARLAHPNIVQVYDAGQSPNGYYVVMELIEGRDFAALLKEKRMSIAGARKVGQQILGALGHAHARRVVHRDLKPSNLLWTTDGLAKLTDFGLARVLVEHGDVLTRAAGTPCYMAPEQIRGEAVDARSDLYSFGCVIYEMLCQRPPFSGGGSIYHHLNSPAPDPRTLRPEISDNLAAIILRCLAKDAGERPASAEEVAAILAE